MEVLIDDQKVVDIEATVMTSEGHEYLVLDVENATALLGAWRDLDPKRRWFSWPATRDYEDMAIAWYSEATGLVGEWVPPYWDGREEYDAHSLGAISNTLPAGTLKWGHGLTPTEPKED